MKADNYFYRLGWDAANMGYSELDGSCDLMTLEQKTQYMRGFRDCERYSFLTGLGFALFLLSSFVLLAVFVIK